MSVNKEISSLSYTSKDFGSIYPEMLDLAKELTNKWDPSQSNESDPGVVLIKEGAFVADHNNYNIDKNVLENFLPSATQDRSVRNITEMNGYTPQYYISANGEVTFVYNKPKGDENDDLFSIPAFTFVISDADETVSYTQIEDLAISGSGIPSSCRFIEGTLQTLSINDTSTISLENLDDNNRLYLPETMVAQNGIYIRNINTDDYEGFWSRNNYLLTQPLGSRVYKIDYDSTRLLPYIEFPTDIANLIGDGLQIQYIATSGIQGNVSANALTKILSPSTFTDIGDGVERSSENFTVYNAGSIVNGKDPETINEMYQSFRRVVGTFDTLVTCKDYENKIYTLTDNNDNPLVSNVYVTDRRTDYNKAAQVISWDIENNFKRFKTISTQKCALHFMGGATLAVITQMSEDGTGNPGDMYYCTTDDNGLYVNMSTIPGIANYVRQEYVNLNDFSILTQAMTPYDLVLYGFKAFAMSDYNSNYYWIAYNNSFTPISEAVRDEIKSDIEEVKCISHTWNDPSGTDVYCFKNYAPLNILITPYNKVSEVEKNEILDNIRKELSDKFNPRRLEFGVKLDVEDLEDVIIASDSRIRRVDILPIEYHTKAMNSNGVESDVTGDLLLDLVAKNILAGRICLFDFNEEFDYDYGQLKGSTYKNQETIKTELYIPLTTSEDEDATHEQTSEVQRSATRFKSNGNNYKYSFIIQPDDSESGTKAYALTSDASYTLRAGKTDSFIIYELDGNNTNKIIKTTTFTSGIDTSVTITNKLDDATLSTTTSKTVLDAGDIIVTKDINVKSIESGVINIDYTLNKNEAIQIIYPNYYSDTTYATYVNYRYVGSETDSIKANTDHTLKASEKIILIYSQEGVQSTEILYPGDVVFCSFDLIPTDLSATVGTKKDWTDKISGESHVGEAFKTLGTNQTISKRKLMTTKLNSTGIWCYWIVNSDAEGNNVLFNGNTKTRILRSNEYFIYTNSLLNEMIILGAGTKLERTDEDSSQWTIPANTLTIESISNTGVSTAIPWQKNINFAATPFYITEMNIITLGETDSIKIIGWSSQYMPRIMEGQTVKEFAFNRYGYDSDTQELINDGFSMCDGSIIYTVNGTSTTLPPLTNFYEIKSRLDLNVGPGIEQQLVVTKDDGDNLISAQRVIFNINGVDIPVSAENRTNCYVQASANCVKIGNIVNLSQLTNFFVYTKDENSYSRGLKITNDMSSYTSEAWIKYPFYCEDINNKQYLIPIHMTGSEVPVKVKFEAKSTSGTSDYNSPSIYDYNTTLPYTTEGGEVVAITEMDLSGNNSYYISPSTENVSGIPSTVELYLCIQWVGKATSENETLYIDDLVVIDGVNPDIDIFADGDDTSLDKLNARISAIIKGSDQPSIKPYYPYTLDNSIAMDTVDFKNAYSMWDKNNIANKMTIAQIDLQNSVMEIVKDMRNGSY